MAKTAADRAKAYRDRMKGIQLDSPDRLLVLEAENRLLRDRVARADALIDQMLRLHSDDVKRLEMAFADVTNVTNVTNDRVTNRHERDERSVTVRSVGPLPEPSQASGVGGEGGALASRDPIQQTSMITPSYGDPDSKIRASERERARMASVSELPSRDERSVTNAVTNVTNGDITKPVTGLVSRSGRVRPPGACGHVPEESFGEKKLTPEEEPSHARPVTRAARHANGVGVLRLGGERSGEQ